MREGEGSRRHKERGIFDRAIDLGLGLASRRTGECHWGTGDLQCSPARGRDWRRGDGKMGNGSQGGPSGRQPLLQRPQPSVPDGSSLWSRARCAWIPGIVSFVHRKNWNRWRDGTLLPTSLVVQLTGSVGTGRVPGLLIAAGE